MSCILIVLVSLLGRLHYDIKHAKIPGSCSQVPANDKQITLIVCYFAKVTPNWFYGGLKMQIDTCLRTKATSIYVLPRDETLQAVIVAVVSTFS